MSTGTGLLGLLALMFIGLKLAEVGAVATWPWWVVLAPLWAPLALALGVFAVFCLVAAAAKVWRR